jgi:hypothetical protein
MELDDGTDPDRGRGRRMERGRSGRHKYEWGGTGEGEIRPASRGLQTPQIERAMRTGAPGQSPFHERATRAGLFGWRYNEQEHYRFKTQNQN